MNRKAIYIIIVSFVMLVANRAEAQHRIKDRLICRAVVLENNDTLPTIDLKEVTIIASRNLLTPDEIRRNKRLIRNIKIVLPYAKLAKNKLYDLNNRMLTMSEKERKEFMKIAEKEIEQEYGEQLKKMTFSQGNLLIKLVDRETGSSSYALVKELRGSFRAFFYQTFAKVFGYDLKAEYDPKNNKRDNLIERVVRAIELKQI